MLASPPQIFKIKSVATFNPSSIEFGSIPLSNLNLASVSIFKALDVFLTDEGRKYADSKKIFFVSSSVPDLLPPITPPKPSTPLLSVITHIPPSNIYFFSSRASKVSFFLEFLTIISLSILSAS